MSEANVTINFVGVEEAIEKTFVSIRLDSEANEGKTSFEAGDTVYLMVFYTDGEYEYDSSGGTLKRTKTKVPTEVEDDYVSFAMAKNGYISYPPSGSVSSSWVGNSGGSPSFDGREVTIPELALAVLKCDYLTLSDQFSIKFEDEGAVVVLVTLGSSQASLTVSFGITEAEPVSYNIKVSDYCSGESVSGAVVNITTSGELVEGEILAGGTTNVNGEVYLGMLVPGKRYDLNMTCAGYIASGSDELNNDFFIVPD